MAEFTRPATLPLEFHLGGGDKLTDMGDAWNPNKNHFLMWPTKTKANYRALIKGIWDANADFMLDQLARESAFADRWVKAFKSTIPREDWWYLGLFRYIGFYASEVEYHNGQDMFTDTKSKVLSDKFLQAFQWCKSNQTDGDFDLTGQISSSFGVFSDVIRWMYNQSVIKASLGGTKKFSDVVAMLDEGRPFELKIVYEPNAHGVYNPKEFLLIMSLTYANRSELYKSFEYSTNIITTVGEKDWTGGKGEPSLYGIELEVCTDYTEKNVIDAFPEIFAICKKDSTITGSKKNKFEIVTVPASMRVHKKMWAGFFKNLNEDMFDVLDKHNNGMHVHIDRKAFDQDMLHLKKFCWFFSNPVNTQFLLEISERDRDSMSKWSSIPKAKNIKESERALQGNGKHTIINLGKGPTVEVRMFKGIVSFASLIKNLEFVDAILEFTKVSSMSQMTLRGFMKWLEAMPKSTYRTLRLCIEDMNLIDMLLLAQIEEIFVAATGPADAVVKLNKSTIAMNKSLVSKVVASFKAKYEPMGCKVTYDDGGFVLIREGTKFAKFNDAVSKMYSRA